MVFETFALLVALMALGYAVVARYLQNKLVNRSEMEAVQQESRRLSEEYKKATERKDKKKTDEIMQKQLEMLPKMNRMMFGQMKPMFLILGVFLVFTWVAGQLDPSTKDDITIDMADDGTGCDATARDGIFSACYAPANGGRWLYTATALTGNAQTGHNSSYFYYDAPDDGDAFTLQPGGQSVLPSTDRRTYSAGETVRLYAQSANANRMTATLDNGTTFYVDLPFAIPLINVQRIYQTYWWFIFISLIASLSISVLMSRMQKKKKEGEK